MAGVFNSIGEVWPTWTTSTDSSTTSGTTWHTWNGQTAATCQSSTDNVSIDNAHIYRMWCSGTSNVTITNCTASYDATWSYWVDDSYVYVSESREALPGFEQQERERSERLKKVEKARKEAEEKAKQLLLDLIGEEQTRVYEETGRLLVHGRKHDYIVQKEGFVQKVEKDKIIDLCIHLDNRHAIPETDNVIALKMLAEADEETLNQIANNHGSRDRPQELPKCACM